MLQVKLEMFLSTETDLCVFDPLLPCNPAGTAAVIAITTLPLPLLIG